MLERELAFANEVADRAAEIAMSLFMGEFEVRIKPDASPVTEADLAIEEMFRERVAERFPRDAVIGEEGGAGRDAERVWVIDPIDGTKNFSDGVPLWATLLALRVEGRGVLGLIGAPATGDRYEAVRGEGARLNGRPIRVSARGELADAFIVFSSVDGWLEGPRREAFEGLLRETRRNRGFGDYFGHMLVARGAADVMAEGGLAIWDWAAPQVIVEEAGGRVTTFEGAQLSHGSSVLTTNGLLHDELVRRLTSG
ncbi:MAG: histidinol-phosphatase [Actinobacteria bacterium]|nr:histidinol-phosphatase [Actinomycetota bacterium]